MLSQKRCMMLQFAILAFIFLCLLPIAAKPSIWYDESFTINIAQKSLPEVIRLTAQDVHPPFYYLIVKLFISIGGTGFLVMRLPSLLCYAGLIIVSIFFFHRYFSPQCSLLVTVILCSVPNMFKYALELRMYSMSMLLVTSGAYVAYELMLQYDKVENPPLRSVIYRWLLFAILGALSAYTHYFAGVASAATALLLLVYLIFRRKQSHALLHWAGSCALMFLLYLPWLPTLLKQMRSIDGNYWIAPVTESNLHLYPEFLFSMPQDFLRTALIVVFVTGSLLCILRIHRDTDSFWIVGCFGVILLWMTFGIGYSMLRNPILIDRYLLVLFPLFWIPPAYGWMAQKNWLPILLLLFAFCCVNNYEMTYDDHASLQQITLESYIKENAEENDIFFHFGMSGWCINRVYFPEYEHYVVDSALNGCTDAFYTLTDGYAVESLDQIPDASHIWCFNGDWVGSFEALGYQIDSITVGNQEIYKLYK